MTDYTDIVARFTDQLAAETLAKFIADAGISCDVVDRVDVVSPMPESYGVRVPRDRIGELNEILKLTPVEEGLTPVAAELMAGRLAREGIPCYVGGWRGLGFLAAGYLPLGLATPLKGATKQGCMIAVPESRLKDAMDVLNQPPISDAELTELALRTPPDPDDPT